jgi:flavin-dependent dehydrogenase
MERQSPERECDVAVVGGALSGAAVALMLKRRDPSLNVVVIEKGGAFKRRVGEATVEVSAYFLCRVLGLTQFLTQTQMAKNGLRFWFSNGQCADLGDCSEVGGRYLSAVPSFLVDRSVLDEEVLRLAREAGADVRRPASVLSADLAAGGKQLLKIREGEETFALRARWVVDASGIKCLLSRSNGWWRRHEEHPTLSAWSRWRGVRDWDSEKLNALHPGLGEGYVGIRGTATNHLVGDGWWAWWIQLKGGDTSIGVVVDPRCANWPDDDATVGEKLRSMLAGHAAGKEMLRGAEFIAGDVHFRRNLPYHSEVYAGDGFVLVGDAAAFLDPFYSPGMDWISFTASAAVRTIMKWREGADLAPVLEAHNRDFAKSFRRMYEALYENKYDYMGDYELMRVAFRLDIALYYLFVVRPIFFQGPELLELPPYSVREAGPIFAFMRLYNRRFAAMGRLRRKESRFGRRNAAHRDLFPGFNFNVFHLLKIIASGAGMWAWLELTEGWRSWGRARAHAPVRENSEEIPAVSTAA